MQKGPVGLLLIMFPKLLAFPALVNSLLELFFFVCVCVVIACPSWASFHYSLLFILVIHSSLSQCHQHVMTFPIPFLSPLAITTLPQTPRSPLTFFLLSSLSHLSSGIQLLSLISVNVI